MPNLSYYKINLIFPFCQYPYHNFFCHLPALWYNINNRLECGIWNVEIRILKIKNAIRLHGADVTMEPAKSCNKKQFNNITIQFYEHKKNSLYCSRFNFRDKRDSLRQFCRRGGVDAAGQDSGASSRGDSEPFHVYDRAL